MVKTGGGIIPGSSPPFMDESGLQGRQRRAMAIYAASGEDSSELGNFS
jgi:hypothetical protein